MGEHQRKADGRRVFSTEFKRTTVQRILTGEKTLAELSRELEANFLRAPLECRQQPTLEALARPAYPWTPQRDGPIVQAEPSRVTKPVR
jgi:transposase-like protein